MASFGGRLVCLNLCGCVHYVLAFVKLRITFSILMYVMCVMFVLSFEPWGRHFTNVRYYYKSEWCHLQRHQATHDSLILFVIVSMCDDCVWSTKSTKSNTGVFLCVCFSVQFCGPRSLHEDSGLPLLQHSHQSHQGMYSAPAVSGSQGSGAV